MMKKEFQHEYDFFPITFILPYEMNLFKKEFYEKKNDNHPAPPQVEQPNSKQ